jgi:hypothetical protein
LIVTVWFVSLTDSLGRRFEIAGRPKLVDQLARVLRLGVTSWVRWMLGKDFV